MIEIGNGALEKQFTKLGNFDTIPKGFVIFDTRNNPWYPFEEIILDTPKYNSQLIWNEYRKRYSLIGTPEFLPWHFTVEIIDRNPTIQATRPITYKSLVPDHEEKISICIVGDTSRDVYTPRYYKLIADICINPYKYIQSWRLHADIGKTIDLVNIGDNFVSFMLERYFR